MTQSATKHQAELDLARLLERDGEFDWIEVVARFSMLHPEVLRLMYWLPLATRGSVLEIGAFKGGGTISLAKGLIDRGGADRLVTIEKGGPQDHPWHGTEDIVADLERNLTEHGVRDRVDIIPAWSFDPAIFLQVRRAFENLSIGLFAIDSDAQLARNLWLYGPLLDDHCVVMFDDYGADETASVKAHQVQDFVASATERGLIEPLGLFGYGTWFGRLTGAEARAELTRGRTFFHESGSCWVHLWGLPADVPTDTETELERSDAVLLEDGRPLGPAHAIHEDIRRRGGGRYSIWVNRWVFFSTSDGSDPNTNGRRYAVTWGDQEVELTLPPAYAAE